MTWTYLNDSFVLKKKVTISPFDRGFLFGDSIYEVIPVYDSKPFLLEKHLNRLEDNLKKISIKINYQRPQLVSTICELIEKNLWKDQYVYIQITRGVELTRNHLPSGKTEPTIFIFSSELNINPYRNNSEHPGLKVSTCEDLRWERCDIKTTSLIPNVMAMIDSYHKGYQEVLMHKEGKLTESGAGSIFLVVGEKIVVPILQRNILNGVTRSHVITLLERLGLKLEERDVALEELFLAREVWYTSSTKEIQPISFINDHHVISNTKELIWPVVLDAYVRSIRI